MANTIKGNIVNIFSREIFYGEITLENAVIIHVRKLSAADQSISRFILPGFIDAHVHIESSMLVPAEFAKLAVVHGTVGTVSDPHEIANVCGLPGVDFMIENGKSVPFKFHFGVPSCVPATIFETAGAELNVAQVESLLSRDDVYYLSEMMNFPGVLQREEQVMAKIAAAKKHGKPVDGHAPGLRGETAKSYINAGISTDHECFTKEEALDKLSYGMKILIREGSAAKNFDALISLLNDFPEEIMFCSDDKHPDSLVAGHINELCKRAVAAGIDVFNVLRAACVNPVLHYSLPAGLLREGDPADFIVVENLVNFKVLQTWVNGECVAENGTSKIKTTPAGLVNNFNCAAKRVEHFQVPATAEKVSRPVIGALAGQLITNKLGLAAMIENGMLVSNVEADVLKIVVVNRYHEAPVAKAFVNGIGLKKGAIASSVAHDSHNIICVGVDDESICEAINLVIKSKGGISCADFKSGKSQLLPLPVAGLMSNLDGYAIAKSYTEIDQAAKALGSVLPAPFMTLSFMALLVIPHLKLSDLGLFDGDAFALVAPAG